MELCNRYNEILPWKVSTFDVLFKLDYGGLDRGQFMSELDGDLFPLQGAACGEASLSCNEDVAALLIKTDYNRVDEADSGDGFLEVFCFKVSALAFVSEDCYLGYGEGVERAVQHRLSSQL